MTAREGLVDIFRLQPLLDEIVVACKAFYHPLQALSIDERMLRYGACGTIRQNRLGFPRAKNDLPKRADRGAIRWLRDGPLLYTKWMDTREVTMCSTIHKVYSGDFGQRVRNRDGTWTTRRIPIPAPVKACNRVDLSDALLKLYNVTQKTQNKTLHKEMALAKGGKPLTKRRFREELCVLLADRGRAAAPEEPTTSRGTEAAALGEASATEEVECNPITIVDTSLTESHLKATEGRKYCVLCAQDKKRNKTIWKYDFKKDPRTGQMQRQGMPFKGSKGDLPDTLQVAEGARVMLTRNIDVEDGLVNGSFGKIAI
ncbi:hypothetical protein SKAU_G00385490 [Synaphobranchus kaupii]|uniref:PiggyBac transposable element-derived protein domain-containing protein n=1 Tax=Synaphobranchus kaupii TaxID=118154 RepID=A0A9Q1EEF4_SYNKA|nr:hypothetical protein SKAU_G00385490 [Synaphobranchus kaupii]